MTSRVVEEQMSQTGGTEVVRMGYPQGADMPDAHQPPTIESAAKAAADAAPAYAALTREERAAFLKAIALEIEGLGDELLETANRETHLPLPRLTGERGRTCGQLRMFAQLILSDDWLDIRVEHADLDRKPLPKPDLRRTQVPIGPVAVFGASNFPFAFSVAGGDTAAALAAGCPVVVKIHPGHPETSRLTVEAIRRAAASTGMPEGVFGAVAGGVAEGQALVMDPHIAAIAFTGSHAAGRSIYNLAATRENPIPVFAEMGSINPVFLLPGAVASRGEALGKGFTDSLTLGVGQFCTNPGLVVGIDGPEWQAFLSDVADRLASSAAGKMLTEGIHDQYVRGVASRRTEPGVTTLACGDANAPALFSVSAQEIVANPSLRGELFGPPAVAVTCGNFDELQEVVRALEGQLTATVHFEDTDHEQMRHLLPLLAQKAGRLIANGFPTGVEVNSAMQHGGPYPATTDSRSTSVGTGAILRFVRPLAYQDFPEDLLPRELRGR